jgi:hypothetical protein
LVQLTYSHSLEELLVKEIKYDPQLYLSNLRKINGSGNDKNRVVDNLTVPFRIILNRLKYVEALLGKFNQDRAQGKGKDRKNVVVGVIPSVGEGFSEEQENMLKDWVENMFIGGLYATQGEGFMAVLVPLEQAKLVEVEGLSPGLMKLGSVNLLVSSTETEILGPQVRLRY